MERVNGEQLKQTIDLLSVNYTKEEMIKFYNSQLTTKQLGEVVRQMLNDVKYDNKPKSSFPLLEEALDKSRLKETLRADLADLSREELEVLAKFINNGGV